MAMRFKNRGGTLLEVLVSLIILTLVASSVVEVAAQRRCALAENRRSQAGLEWAMTWRTASLQHQEWTKGESGNFLGHDDIHWSLERIGNEVGAGPTPDDSWRRLVISLSPADQTERASFVFRLPDAATGVADAAGGRE